MSHKYDREISAINASLAQTLDCGADEDYDWFNVLINRLFLKSALRVWNARKDFPEFAHRVMTTQQRLMRNCFVPLNKEQFLTSLQSRIER